MSLPTAIDLTATVTTPENIQFEYRIAGPFRRIPAFLMDWVIRGVSLLVVALFLTCTGILTAFQISGAISIVILLMTLFFLDWFYGLFFETYWNGKTPGKWLAKIQVISADGRPINAYQATIRNFLRLGDLAPFLSFEIFSPDAPPAYMIPTGLVAMICMTLTRRFQRLGDLAAGTMVVVDERKWVPPNVKLEDPRISALAEYIPPNFRMSRSMARAIALYAERRARMPVARRMELAAILAKPLMKEFDFRDDTSPDLLLCALYYREFVIKDAFTAESRSRAAALPVPSNIPSPAIPNPVIAPPPITSMPLPSAVIDPVEEPIVTATEVVGSSSAEPEGGADNDAPLTAIELEKEDLR